MEPKNRKDTAPVAFVVERGGDRVGGALNVPGGRVSVKISSRDTGGAFALLEDQTNPFQGPPLHLHRHHDESWYILEGEYLFEIDGRQIHARAGDTLFAARGTPHAFQNLRGEQSRMLLTSIPGGMDLMFEEVSAMLPPGGEIDMTKFAPLMEKYGLEVLGPPLAARRAA